MTPARIAEFRAYAESIVAQPKHACGPSCQLHEPARRLLVVLDALATEQRRHTESVLNCQESSRLALLDTYKRLDQVTSREAALREATQAAMRCSCGRDDCTAVAAVLALLAAWPEVCVPAPPVRSVSLAAATEAAIRRWLTEHP